MKAETAVQIERDFQVTEELRGICDNPLIIRIERYLRREAKRNNITI